MMRPTDAFPANLIRGRMDTASSYMSLEREKETIANSGAQIARCHRFDLRIRNICRLCM